MVVRLKEHLHQNHTNNTREIDENVQVMQGDYGIGDPQLDHIASLVEKVNAEKPYRGPKRTVFLFSSLGTIEYALQMSGCAQAEIAEFYRDKTNRPQCFFGDNTLYIACYDLDIDKLGAEIKDIW